MSAAIIVMRQIEVTAYDADGQVIATHNLLPAWTAAFNLVYQIKPNE